MSNVTIPETSRYKDSFQYTTDDGLAAIGPFQVPEEFVATSPLWTVHTVIEAEVGFLDSLAATYFGAGSEMLWWVIALVNGIVDADLDMFAGQRLMVPPRDVVSRFIARGNRG